VFTPTLTFLEGSSWNTVWSGRLSWSVAIITAVNKSSYMLASSSGLVELSDVSSAASESCFLASAAAALRAYNSLAASNCFSWTVTPTLLVSYENIAIPHQSWMLEYNRNIMSMVHAKNFSIMRRKQHWHSQHINVIHMENSHVGWGYSFWLYHHNERFLTNHNFSLQLFAQIVIAGLLPKLLIAVSLCRYH
jgi:hypothetical protein